MDVKRLNRLLSMLLEEMKQLSDDDRDLPLRWSLMHMYSSSQLAKLIALKRGLDVELASIAAALHDIAAVETGKRERHAEIAEEYVRGAVGRYNDGPRKTLPFITGEETDTIVGAIVHHSEKEIETSDPLIELLKDVDALDRFLHGVKTEGPYLARCRKVLDELGIHSPE